MNRVKFPLPQPIPDTRIRGIRFVKIDFGSPALKKMALAARKKAGSRYAIIKPKRSSRGILWNGKPYYWTRKGYYRCGLHTDRRPLQVHVWEKAHRKNFPKGWEIFFKNRDRHDFRTCNIQAMTKSDLHERTIALGEVTQISTEQRMQIAGKRWLRRSRDLTNVLLNRFNQHESNEHSNTIASVHQRRTTYTRGA